MVVTFRNLVGTRENLDKSIRFLLQDNWTSANTLSITPDFESDTEEPDFLAQQDNTGPNKVYVSFIARSRTEEPEDEPLGDSVHLWQELIELEVHAESLALLLLFEDEINKIIWENRPDGSTRLVKSNGTQDSHIEYFDNSELTFERIEPDDENDVVPKSTAALIGWFYKNRT